MPRPRKSCAESRSHISLDATANRHVETNKRRVGCYNDFCGWIKKELHLPLTGEHFPPLRMSEALTGYGKHLFYSGLPKYLFAETINAVIDRFPNYKGQISAAWTTLSKWEEAEPVDRAMIMPPSIFRAAISLSLLWGWYKFAGAMLLGFHGLLRPSEILPLKRSDLVLPRDVLSDERICYVKILRSKTSRFMLRQNARVSDELTVVYLDSLFGCLANTETLFGCSTSFFRTRWNRLFKHLGIPTSERARGLTPKALRGSGASLVVPLHRRCEQSFVEGSLDIEENFGALLARCFGASFACRLDPRKERFVFGTSRRGIVFASFGCRPS